MAMRFPTQDETDLGFAIQCAEDAERARNPRPPERRDQDDLGDAPPPPPRVMTGLFCPQCGKVFDYATKGMTALQMKKHMRKEHPEQVETY
jgi:hypothetical protein